MSHMPESVDIEDRVSLRAYLFRTGCIGADESLQFRVLVGGVSNRTVWIGRMGGQSLVLKQGLGKLRVESEWSCSPERVAREALGMRWLAQLLPPGTVPQFLFEDRENHLLAMTAVPEPHWNWKTVLMEGHVDSTHFEQFGALLAAIHWGGFERRAEVAAPFGDTSFFEALRLEPYYEYTAGRVPAAAAFLGDLIRETRRTKLTLVHGDYSPKNILVHGGRLVLIDHEVIHFGDPAFDVGFSLAHLLSKAHHLSEFREKFAAAAQLYWRQYINAIPDGEWAGRIEGRAVRHALGCLLARVDGKSPLEYLTPRERMLQRHVVLNLMAAPPGTVPAFIEACAKGFSCP
jgi:5-methylthioribose kinase